MKKLGLVVLAIISLFGGLVLFSSPAQAVNLSDQVMGQISAGAKAGGLGQQQDPRIIAAALIKILLSLLGTIFFVLMVLSAYWLITARGDEEKETKAKDTIRRAVIGLVVILISYGIVVFASKQIQRAASLADPYTHPAAGLR